MVEGEVVQCNLPVHVPGWVWVEVSDKGGGGKPEEGIVQTACKGTVHFYLHWLDGLPGATSLGPSNSELGGACSRH